MDVTVFTEPIDLGHGHTAQVTGEDGVAGVRVDLTHPRAGKPGMTCRGSLMLDLPGVAERWPDRPVWEVEDGDGLTLWPDVICMCGDAGFIRNGKWWPSGGAE
jgi:hypothetical protein